MKFSVIIPVYNRGHMLATCVEGILNTIFEDFEVIVINDGSTDNTLAICQELASKYNQVKVFSQNNSGVSAARNMGLRKASGEYILFVDSDDTLAPNALSEINRLLSEEYDLFMFGFTVGRLFQSSLIFKQYPKIRLIKNITGNENCISWLFSEYNPYENPFYTVWAKVFKSDVLKQHSIFFREDLSLGEDQVFVCDYLKHVQTLYYTNQNLYINLSWTTKKRSSSLGSMFRPTDSFLYHIIENYKSLINLYETNNISFIKEYAVNYILDRPISRIIFRNTNLFNLKRICYSNLKNSINKKIKPVLALESDNIAMLRNKEIAKCVSWIMNDKLTELMFYSYFNQSLAFIKSIIFRMLCFIKHSVVK